MCIRSPGNLGIGISHLQKETRASTRLPGWGNLFIGLFCQQPPPFSYSHAGTNSSGELASVSTDVCQILGRF